jgi:hypothetical protein
MAHGEEIASSADEDGRADGERDGDPVRARWTLDGSQGKVVLAQPRRESIGIAAQLHPGDAVRCAAVLGDRVARVVDVVDVPLDEERKAVGQRGIEGDQVPCELDAVGTGATHRQRLAPGSSGGRLDVVGAQAERRGPSGLKAASSGSTTAMSSM